MIKPENRQFTDQEITNIAKTTLEIDFAKALIALKKQGVDVSMFLSDVPQLQITFYPTPKSPTMLERVVDDHMTVRSAELVKEYRPQVLRELDGTERKEQLALENAIKALEDFRGMLSRTKPPYVFGSDSSIDSPYMLVHTGVSWFNRVAPTGLEFATCYFIPEIILAAALVRVIMSATAEVSQNLAHKLIAVNCWRKACEGLALVAFLYAVQLCIGVPSGTAFYGYLYVSEGLVGAKLFVALTSLFVLHSSGNYIREHTRHVLEYPLVIIVAVLFLLLLVSTSNLLLLFLVLAGFSLNMYILVVFDVADAASREASLKYFYLSTLSTGFILFGTLLIYVMLGEVSYRYISFCAESSFLDLRKLSIISTGVTFIVMGFLFKLSAFPGHLWAVEVYEGSPMPVMAFFILPVKIAVFVAFLRLLSTAFYSLSDAWLPLLSISAVGSLAWGGFAAIHSRKTIRFLGYASINQMGFLILGLATNTDLGLRAALFYLLTYAVMSGGFLLVLLNLRKKDGTYFIALSDFRGIWKTENLICWNLASSLFSMAGTPPLAGFFGKYYILSSALDRGMFIPVITALSFSVITTQYYIRIIRTLWFEEEEAAVKAPEVLLSDHQRVLLASLSGFLWVVAPFLPVILPVIEVAIFTLTICGDASMFAYVNWPLHHPPEVFGFVTFPR